MSDNVNFVEMKSSTHKFHVVVFSVLSLVALLACEMEKADTSKIKDELEARKIKRVKKGELMAYAESRGKELIEIIKVTHPDSLESILNDNNVTYKTYNSDSLGELSEIERSIVEAYQYSSEQGDPLPDNLQSIDNESRIIFTRAESLDSNGFRVHFLTFWRKYLILEM